jgi:signal peptidase
MAKMDGRMDGINKVARRLRNWSLAPLGLLALVVAIYLAGYLVLPRFISGWAGTYVVWPVLWLLVAGVALLLGWPGGRNPLRFSAALALPALLLGVAQVGVLVIAGAVLGFGYSPYDHSPLGILVNLVFVGTMLVGVEFSRAFVLGALRSRGSLLVLGGVAVLFTLLSTPLARLVSLANGSLVQSIPTVASDMFPSLAENLVTSYLALIGGPLAAIAYRGVLEAFIWFSPILPNLPWAIKALLGTTLPIVAFLLVEALLPREAAEPVAEAPSAKASSKGQSGIVGWLVVALIGLGMLSFSLGLLPVHAALVGGGSMEPVMYLGDVAVLSKASGDTVHTGEVIQYRKGGIIVLHRIIDTVDGRGGKAFITKGDNNNVADSEPVLSNQVMGKLVTVIPKVGWLAIMARAPSGLLTLIGIPVLILLALEVASRWRRRRLKSVPSSPAIEEGRE